MKYISCIFVFLVIFSINNSCFALGKIVDYFLDNPNAWEETKRITQKEPTKVVVINGTDGIGFNLTELTARDEVALVFLESNKSEKLNREGFFFTSDKLKMGKNRVVSVITRNHGNRMKFHYEFKLQRKKNGAIVNTYNNNRPVLECEYDGSKPVKGFSDLSGINMCEIEVFD